VAVGNEVADIPFDRALGEPEDFANNEALRVGYTFEHRFDENWKVRNTFKYSKLDLFSYSAFTGIGFFDQTTGVLGRGFIAFDEPSDTFELQTNVVGEFNTGSVVHKVLAGIDLYRREEKDITLGDPFTPTFINIFNPVYGTVPRPDLETLPIIGDSSGTTDALGVYIQDQVTLLDNLKLLAGIRYETIEQETFNNPTLLPLWPLKTVKLTMRLPPEWAWSSSPLSRFPFMPATPNPSDPTAARMPRVISSNRKRENRLKWGLGLSC